MNEDERIDQEIQYLLDVGALTISGMDGEEPVYNMVPEVLKIVSPDLYEIMMKEIDDTVLSLYKQGLVSIEYNEDLKAIISITDDGIDMVEEMIKNGNGYS